MPTFEGQVSEDTVLQIIAYIKSLAEPAAPATQGATKGGQKQ
jgi:cytochrome c1